VGDIMSEVTRVDILVQWYDGVNSKHTITEEELETECNVSLGELIGYFPPNSDTQLEEK
jgi:hypothetical protein